MVESVKFLTLFLSLVTGSHPVEVAVQGEVVRVELRLDGRMVASRAAPPWDFEIDFGPALLPHEFEVVALDDNGEVVARDRQFVNLPQQTAQTRVVVNRTEEDGSFIVSISTVSATLEEPTSYRATLNGLPLDVSNPERVNLGRVERDLANILSVEAFFPNGVTARTDVTVGTSRGSKAATDLTAVAVATKKRIRKPDVSPWVGTLTLDDGSAVVMNAVERQGQRLYVVRAEEAWPYLRQLGERFRYRRGRSARGPYVLFSPETGPEDDQLIMVDVYPQLRVSGEQSVGVFEPSLPVDLGQRTVEWTVTRALRRTVPNTAQAVADSVAVAGLMASASKCPRAVLLIIADATEDASHHSPSAVRAFLNALHVPLFVWRVGPKTDQEEVWGEVVQAGRSSQLKRAAKTLNSHLDRQLILWVEGQHMPNRIRLSGGPKGATLVGDP